MFWRSAHQKSLIINHKKVTVKRSARAKLPIAATPLRQVMSKSIQRAIREHVAYERFSPKSPLDLRLSPVIRRQSIESSNTINPQLKQLFKENVENQNADLSEDMASTPFEIKGCTLETVYETAKNSEQFDECDNQNEINKEIELSVKQLTHSNLMIDETPISRITNSTNDIWYTPNENLPTQSSSDNSSEVNTHLFNNFFFLLFLKYCFLF